MVVVEVVVGEVVVVVAVVAVEEEEEVVAVVVAAEMVRTTGVSAKSSMSRRKEPVAFLETAPPGQNFIRVARPEVHMYQRWFRFYIGQKV